MWIFSILFFFTLKDNQIIVPKGEYVSVTVSMSLGANDSWKAYDNNSFDFTSTGLAFSQNYYQMFTLNW